MAKKRIGDKAERVLKLLLGLRHKKIASALASRGFGKDDLEEGLSLLRGVTDVSLAVLPATSPNPAIIEQIDRWENEWFPVANATLLRHHPNIHARVFLNLSQTEGAAVVISVGTFLERIAELGRADAGYGQAGKDARKLLGRRGLTTKVVDDAKALLAQVASIEEHPIELPDLEDERTRLAEAEDAMWAWYLEWAEIARAAIKDRALLRRLGFLTSSSTSSRRQPAAADEDEDVPEGTASPSPTSSAA
jgi:hypothetical protein